MNQNNNSNNDATKQKAQVVRFADGMPSALMAKKPNNTNSKNKDSGKSKK